jgi:hypothetical protein
MTRNLWGDVRSFLLRSPARETLIEFPSLEERKSFSDRILQRVDIDVSPYSVLNLHQIGIHAPVGHVFEELTRWDSTSAFWPNRLATVERVDGGIDQLRFHPLGLVDPEGGGGRWLPPLFELTALRIQKVPGPTDVDNARYLLYACSGGYPIGIFALYVRSAITEQGETEASQLFLGVGFDFYGKKQGFFFHPMNWLWEKIHNRVTANVLDLFKKTCESRFPLQAKRESESDGT